MIEDFENFVQVEESFLVVLDSRNATEENSSYGYNSDLSFKLQTPIIQPVNSLNLKANVLNFTCPNSQFVINETNNVLGISFDTEGTPYYNANYTCQYDAFYILLNVGNYNSYTFITELTNQFNIISNRYNNSLGGFSVSFDTITNKYSLHNNTFYFFISQNVIFDNFFETVFPKDSFYTIGDVMGFDNTKTYFSTPASQSGNLFSAPFSISLPFPVNFSGLQNINIHIENLKTHNVPYQAKNFILSKNNNQEYQNYSKGNIAASIPVNCKPMGVIFYDKIGQFSFSVKDEQLDTIRIALRDDLGNLLNLNGQNWNLTIEFILTKHIEKKTRNFYSILSNPYPRFE
jgi:hypothetical protein